VLSIPSRDSLPHLSDLTYGNNILLLVPTNNPDKTELLKTIIKKDLENINNKEATLVTLQNDVETPAAQPYDDMGVKCLTARTEAMVAHIRTLNEYLEQKKIGTIVIGVVENYIRKSDGVDFGIVMVYNVTINKRVWGVSSGVPTQKEYLEEAQQEGFVDDQKTGGRITYGSVLERLFGDAAREENIDISANWHELVCGKPRYELLKEVIKKLGSILTADT
jgi:hypothetical protein